MFRSREAKGWNHGSPARSGFFARGPVRIRLLLIFFYDLGRADMRLARVASRGAKRAALPQQIPTLIQLDLDFPEMFAFGVREHPLFVQAVFFRDKLLDMIQHRLIFGFLFHDRAPLT